MKKRFLWCIVVFLAIIWVAHPTHADLAGYTIEKYHVSMSLNTNGSMDVTETIGVLFSEPRHGIYRQIPVININTQHITTIEWLTAIWDPIASYGIINGNYELKLWSANKTISWPHTYTIKYTVKNAIVPFSVTATGQAMSWYATATTASNTITWTSWQELYRNIIWLERATTIKNISFDITLPKAYSFGSWQAFAIYGAYWERKTQGMSITQKTPTRVEWFLTSVLQPKQWLTVGLQFTDAFFSLPADYEENFYEPTDTLSPQSSSSSWRTSEWSWLLDAILNNLSSIIITIFWFLVIASWIVRSWLSWWSSTGKKSAWSSNKTTTIYYTPPKDIEPLQAFYFWYNAKNPRIFTALIYYWATKWRAHIEKVQNTSLRWLSKSTGYTITEIHLQPQWQTALEATTMQDFFGTFDKELDSVSIEQTAAVRRRVDHIFDELEDSLDRNDEYMISTWSFFKRKTLTEKWEKLFEELRGFKEYLLKVERPVIEAELKNDPDYINKILPWAVLFWVDTKLLSVIGNLLQETAQWRYSSYDGTLFNSLAFRNMNSAITASTVVPQRSSSWWFSWWGGGFSGFSGWGWFSWWWGWGWWGGSW